MLVVVSISRLLFSRLAITVPAQPFQASIACNLQKIAMAHPTPEDLASSALPPSAQLEFKYPRLNGGQYCPPCPRAFSKASWPWNFHSLARVHGARSVLLRVPLVCFFMHTCFNVKQYKTLNLILCGSRIPPQSRCVTLSIRHKHILTNEIRGAQKC